MSIDKMNELIELWTRQKEEYNKKMDKKISKMISERDLALAAQTQKVFNKHHLSPEELNKLKYANKEQLKKLLKFIDAEVNVPSVRMGVSDPEEDSGNVIPSAHRDI